MRRLTFTFIALAACSNDKAVTGPVGGAGPTGSPGGIGAAGAPGAFATTAPSAPTHVFLTAGTSGAPSYTLHWTAPADGSVINAYHIYDTSSGAKTIAQTSASVGAEVVAADNAVHAFAVSAVSAGGVEGALSSAAVINTAPELFYASGTGVCVADINGQTVPACSPNGFGLSDPILSFAPSPDGKTLAILSGGSPGQLYVVASDGSSVVQLSSLPAGADAVIGYAWSPDGSKLAYLAAQDTAHRAELYLATPSGVVTKINAPPPSSVLSFEWSPDSQHLAYVSPVTAIGDNGLFISALDGTPGIQIGVPTPARTPLFPLAAEGPMQWSFDGQTLFFDTDSNDLISTSLDGSSVTTVTTGINTDLLSPFSLSPDGNSRIAIKSHGTNNEAWIGSSRGGTFSRVSSQVTIGTFLTAQWSPAGGVFALIDKNNLTIMSASGEQVAIAGEVTTFAWSPSGNTLTYAAHSGAVTDLFDCDHAAANCVNISKLPGAAAVSDFSWSPANDALLWHDASGEQLTWTASGVTQALSSGSSAVWRSPGFVSPVVVGSF